MKHASIVFWMIGIQFTAYGSSPYLISFFIKPLSSLTDSSLDKRPRALHPWGAPLLHTGIFVSYAGFFAHSDHNGQVLLPRKTDEPVIHIIITERLNILPISPLKKKTIIGFTLPPKAKRQHLLYTREKDVETDTYVWRVKQTSWPSYKKIPYDTLIIFADPEAIISPVGTTTTELSENFILPDFYITNSTRAALDAFRFLTIKSFVAPLPFAYSFHPKDIQKLFKT